MEGSPVRGQQKVPIVQLNESRNLQSFQAEIVRLVGLEFKHAEIFFAVVDAESGGLELPAWIKTHLERHAALQKKLEQGEMVGVSATEENPVLRPAAAVRSNVVLIPVMAEGKLAAAIGLVSLLDGPQLSAEDLETVRQSAYEAAPILARLQEIEKLRRENQGLATKAQRLQQADERLGELGEARNALEAVLQMRSHQQIHVAHELRTPLAAVRGYARMILDGRGGDINETQREYLRIVTENTNRLIALVSWMSYVAELSAQHLKLSTFDFRDLWTECVNRSKDKLAEKSLKLAQRVAEEQFVLIGDREKLAYVLNEIITAAVILAAEGSTITADLTHGREGEASFKLVESGGEISADVLSKIFERPFNTIVKPTVQDTDSSAISLSGVYDVVGMHGGRVFVNSTPGHGATFLFTLPAIIVGGEENSHEQAVNSSRRRR